MIGWVYSVGALFLPSEESLRFCASFSLTGQDLWYRFTPSTGAVDRGAYLTSQSQWTVVGGSASSWAPLLSGVPQGSILGPILFVVYVNGIFDLTLNSKLMLYADDMLFYRVVDNPEDVGVLDIDTISDRV